MPEMNFEGTASWKGGMECELTVKGKHLVTVSPPLSFGGKEGYCVPEDILLLPWLPASTHCIF
jgi:organic hydroperoxide reductase OsmC/OhrA